MQPGNIGKNERPRPSGVPAEAYWNAGDNEWELPQKNAKGEFHGLVKWWRPDGTLCCVTDHVDGKTHGSFTRYHENGEPSRTGTFVRGTLHGTNVFTRSTEKTTENFPSGLGKHIWRCEMDFVEGRMTEGRLFDREGGQVMEDGTPFPKQRPAGVPSSAFFRKSEDRGYCWVYGEQKLINDSTAWERMGTWQFWNADGVLLSEEPYEAGKLHGVVKEWDVEGNLVDEKRYVNGERQFDRPRGVPIEAQFDSDDECWMLEHEGDDGDRKRWDAAGVLRMVETYKDGGLVRVLEYLADGSLGQDSTLFDFGVPKRKWFRRTEDEELDSFPNIDQDEGREVEYLFDDHGRMSSYRIVDENKAELEAETLYRNAANDSEQDKFDSLDEASAAWIEAGGGYTSLINKWLHELYNLDEPTFEEPTFGNMDLERAVVDGVEALNARGDGAQAHAKFPLYYDGIGKAFWDRYGLVVSGVLRVGDDTYARVQHPEKPYEIFKITNERIVVVDGLKWVGASYDKRYVAFAYDDRIEVQRGNERIKLAYPTSYQHAKADALEKDLGSADVMGIFQLRVLPNGSDVLLATSEGIYVIGPERTQRLYPLDATFDEYVAEHEGDLFELELQFPNCDVSPQGDRITCGGMFKRGIMAGLAMFRQTGGKWVLENTSQADAFFPGQAVFHRTKPHIAFAATLYASLSNSLTNTTFRIDLDGLAPGEIDSFGGGIAQEPGVVKVVASFGDGFLLGFDNGYIRWMGVDDNIQLLGYVYVGGQIYDIDVAPDQKSFMVASDSGLVTRFVLGDTASPNLISTIPLVDDSRIGFFRTYSPLRW